MMRIFQLFILPILLLTLGGGCSHHADPNAVGNPPSITLQPVDSSTVYGRPVSFVVTAEGAPVLRYQWTKNGVDILGALGTTFTLFDPQPTDAGSYAVTISNPDGVVTSYAAALTVTPALAFTAPVGVVSDALGNIFVSDLDDHVIWKVDASNHKSLLAGTKGVPGSL